MDQNQEKNSIRALADFIALRKGPVDCTGLDGSQRAYFLYRFCSYLENYPVVLVVDSAEAAEKFMADFHFFSPKPERPVIYFPPYNILPFKYMSYHNETAARRIRALYRMTQDCSSYPPIVVTTSGAAVQKVVPRTDLSDYAELLIENEDIDPDFFIEKLQFGGYEQATLVEEPGDYSVRGGIIDVFSPLYDNPLRIELFGDTVDSLRLFSPTTQRTVKRIGEAVIVPAREIILEKDRLTEMIARVRAHGSEMELPVTKTRELVERIQNEGVFPGMESLMPMIYPELDTFMDHVPGGAIYVLVEPANLERVGSELYEQAEMNYTHAREQAIFGVKPESMFMKWEEVIERIDGTRPVRIKSISVSAPGETGPAEVFHFNVEDNAELRRELSDRGNSESPLGPLRNRVEKNRRHRMTTFLVCETRQRAKRLDDLLKPYGIKTDLSDGFDPKLLGAAGPDGQGKTILCLGEISSGFSWPEESIGIITELEIFGVRHRRTKAPKPKIHTQLLSFEELKQGDLTVHVEHGIGQYDGLVKLELDGVTGDFLRILFRDNDVLYLPVDRMSMIQKYMGVDSIAPTLDKMGGKSWEQVKSRVKKSVEKIAGDLLKLYATRKVRKGFEFPDLTGELETFEAGFPFEETADQLAAIQETLEDMMAPTPMDRLVCGDVGYGKTEVALRASFLAVHSGKQVAMLVPTTVLAEQHFATFCERFKNYPVNVACLSRFRPPKEQRRITEGLINGNIDIVIGTHRLIQKDIGFKDLGLFILDEEQRFGVKHKEKLKRLKSQVDVLTLTATPIPRTLHMSLMGVRDISVLSTPPEYRKAIITYISEFDEVVIREAVRKELKRGGQIFFIHNNVHGIETMARKLRQIAPEARMEVAHGQMREDKLEKVMLRFMNREIDMLVCTTIVESGLDVATANTIFVNRADRFGLSQIYQLRGRVGRSEDQAYAYLFIPRESTLTRNAVKRLKVLMEHSDLGSGFQIAMSDLKIRGGGTILGASQSGHIAAVGYDMFLSLMENAMAQLKGETVVEPLEPEININLSAFLPESYIADIDQRLATYRKLSRMSSLKEISDFKGELEDRFGPLPAEANNLLAKIMLKVLSILAGVRRLDLQDDRLALYFSEQHQKNPAGLVRMAAEGAGRYSFGPDHVFRADLSLGKSGGPLAKAKNILKEISQHVNA